MALPRSDIVRGLIVLIVAVCAAAAPLLGSQTAHASASSYQIYQKYSSTCVDLRGGSSAIGTIVQQYGCNHTAAQQWQLVPDPAGSGAFEIENVDGFCIGDPFFTTATGVAVEQLWCTGDSTELWKLIGPFGPAPGGYYLIENMQNNGCLDNEFSTEQSFSLLLNVCTPPTPGGGGNYNQQWEFNWLQ
jgi:hypothetical protein